MQAADSTLPVIPYAVTQAETTAERLHWTNSQLLCIRTELTCNSNGILSCVPAVDRFAPCIPAAMRQQGLVNCLQGTAYSRTGLSWLALKASLIHI